MINLIDLFSYFSLQVPCLLLNRKLFLIHLLQVQAKNIANPWLLACFTRYQKSVSGEASYFTRHQNLTTRCWEEAGLPWTPPCHQTVVNLQHCLVLCPFLHSRRKCCKVIVLYNIGLHGNHATSCDLSHGSVSWWLMLLKSQWLKYFNLFLAGNPVQNLDNCIIKFNWFGL